MIYGDESYRQKLDMIAAIPSSKVDEVNLKNISEDDMREIEKRHLRELTEQAANMDPDEQIATAAGLRIEILFNAVGEYITAQQAKNAQIKNAIQEE